MVFITQVLDKSSNIHEQVSSGQSSENLWVSHAATQVQILMFQAFS